MPVKSDACPRAILDGTTAPFHSGEEAWFWFMRTEKARADGGRATGMTSATRPCDPDDIYRCVSRLYRERALYPRHLEVLGEYGFLDRVPFPDLDREIIDWMIWTDAMDVIEPSLKTRGIVA